LEEVWRAAAHLLEPFDGWTSRHGFGFGGDHLGDSEAGAADDRDRPGTPTVPVSCGHGATIR